MEENREKNNKKIENEKRLEQDLRQMADEIGAMEMVKGGEIVHDDVTIPQITVNQEKFNTRLS